MVTENVNIIVSLRGARNAGRGLTRFSRSARTATSAMKAFGLALGIVGTALAVRKIVRLSDAATEVGNRIRVVTGSTKQFVAVQNELFNVARRTGQSIEDTSRIFQRLRVGTQDLGVSSQRVIDVVEGLNSALLVSGSTAREASAALLQLGQGLASDRLSGEELRSLRENLPPLAQELAKALGTTIGQLKILGQQGKLTAEVVFKALEPATKKFTDQVRRGEVILTFGAALNRVRNEFIKFFEIIQRATGATAKFNEFVLEATDGLAEKLVRGLIAGLQKLIGFAGVIELMKAEFDSIEGKFTTLANAVKALGGGLVALGEIAVGIVSIIAIPFQTLFAGISGANLLLQKFLNLQGRFGSDAAVEAQQKDFDRSLQNISLTAGNLVDIVKSLGNVFEDEVVGGINKATGSLSPLQRGVQELIDGLTKALIVGDVEDDGKKDDKATFLQRASINSERIRKENETEEIEVQKELSEGIAGSVREGFENALKGGDFFDGVRKGLEEAANGALTDGFERSFVQLQGLLEETFNSVAAAIGPIFKGPFGKLGAAMQDVLKGAIQFAVLQGLNALLGGGGNKTNSSSANVQSAVTSTQAVRGIVAGPTEIAIANVGRNIAEAILPLLDETREQTTILRGILATGLSTTSGGGGTATSDTNALAFGTAPLSAA